MRYYFKKMEPGTSSAPDPVVPEGEGEASTADVDRIASEVQRVNRILEIENLDWEWQLKQAVSVVLLHGSLNEVSAPFPFQPP